MRTNWAMAALGTFGVLGVIVGGVMIWSGQGSGTSYPRTAPNVSLIWAGSGVVGIGAVCGVAALVAAAVSWQIRESARMLTARVDPVAAR